MEQEQIVDAVRDWLDNDNWHYEYDAEHHLIRMGITLKSKIKNARFYIDIKNDCYLVYLVAPINGDTNDLDELLKYLTMANYGLFNGNFELDVADGEVRYKTFVNCRELEELPEAIIAASIYVGCAMMDRYGNGIAALALGFSDAETEIQKAELDDDGDDDGDDDDGDDDDGDDGDDGNADEGEIPEIERLNLELLDLDLPGLGTDNSDASDNG